MALYKQKDSKVWWFEFQFGGERYRESAKTKSKVVAGDAMRARRRQVEESFNGIKKRGMPKLFRAAADEYLLAKQTRFSESTLDIERRAIAHLSPFFSKKLLGDITVTDIKNFIDSKLAAGITPRGVNMKLGTLRAILRRNNAWEQIRPDFKMLRVKEDHGMCLTPSQEGRLLAECRASISRVLYLVVTLSLCTGMRRDEIRLLRWKQVELEKGHLTVGLSKTEAGSTRKLRLNKNAVAAMTDWANQFPNRQPDDYVFPAEKYSLSKANSPVNIYRTDPTRPIGSWRKAFEAARRRAGVSPRFHDLRHTAVTRMFEAGIPLPTIAECMGWSGSTMILMAKKYHHASEEAMTSAFAALELKSSPDLSNSALNLESLREESC